eukprot:TRINITY_DN12712_c0_g4_i1.p1 TRINITY_DN12712_c0_g4~~TRINITY_DN12712_c0_g4_i1.p1  ORF type:complete len:293 (+),score=80.67 TRINITY_DN12712_c0_g4_i1:1212-2090(+)
MSMPSTFLLIAASKDLLLVRLRYYILLILTDGNADDMEYIKDEIIKASRLPISIVIVGLGDNSFDKMMELDNDRAGLRLEGKNSHDKYERDIVQFVPFRKFRSHPGLLEEETLREIPKQFMTFVTERGIKPKIKNKDKVNRFARTTLRRQSTKLALAGLLTQTKNVYFQYKEKAMVQKLLSMGFPEPAVAKLISEGLPSDNSLLAIDIFISRGVMLAKGERGAGKKDGQDEGKAEELHEKQTCLRCRGDKARCAVMPCKHVVLCLECAKRTKKKSLSALQCRYLQDCTHICC